MLKIRKILSLFLLIFMLAGIFSGCNNNKNNEFRSISDFEQSAIGVMTGSSFDVLAAEYLPQAERRYYMNMADLILNLKQGRIDGILMDKGFFTPFMWGDDSLSYIKTEMPATEYGIAFSKSKESEPLKAQIDAFIQAQTENGWLEEQSEKWFSGTEPEGTPDFSTLTGENGTLRIATTAESKPFSYLKDGQYGGFDAELIFRFAQEYGYAVEIDMMDFGGLLTSLAAGRYDLAISSITITEERRESALFSEIYHRSDVVMVISKQNSQTTLSDLSSAKIGILTGSAHDHTAKEIFPNAERVYFNNMADMILAAEQEKIDAYLEDAPFLIPLIWEGISLRRVDESVGYMNNGFVFPQGESTQLRQQMDEFIIAAKSDGTIERLMQKWLGDTEPTEHPDYTSMTGENGTVRLAISVDNKPILYQNADGFTGFEMELLTLFAQQYGYKFDIEVVPFESIIAGISSNKYDMGASSLNITPEREESVDFSESYTSFEVIVVVKDGEDAFAGFAEILESIGESFNKTFIREDRWKLIVKGIGVTVLISICSAVLGSLFGFGLYMLGRSDVKAVQVLANGFAKGYSRIIAGTPVVVILMILFYVVFGKIRDMSGIVVAIIGFTLTFGAFVYDHMTVSVGSVDRGQVEAAYALGYTKNQTFFRIIFPQAMSIFLPSYCAQTVELIKATAIVGYIAVNDLTKMGDIIRSNTYEAFFPLIATAVIYFLLTWGLSLLLQLVKVRFEPKRRSAETILKGVTTK